MIKKILIFALLFCEPVFSHTAHYINISKIEMQVLRNGKIIGFSNYLFSYKDKMFEVKNSTQFDVKLFDVTVFKIKSKSIETYRENQLIKFNSKTNQNDKIKFVELSFDKDRKKFIINGSSFVGMAKMENIIGNWWNHDILNAKSQISPLSGSVKKQEVKFIKNENVTINGITYELELYKLESLNKNLPKDKKLDFDIWYDPKTFLIRKISHQKMGKWEYILTNVE